MTDKERLNEWLLRMENNPVADDTRRNMTAARDAVKSCGLELIRSTREGAARDHALAHLQSALFWANHSAATSVQQGLFE